MRNVFPSILFAFACCVTAPALAHHGWSTYQEGFTLSGTVREINFGNPHDQLVVVDEDGNAWAVLLAPPLRNRRMGFDESAIAVDDAVTLYGQRHYDQEVLEIKTERIERDGKEIYRYPGR